MSNFRDLKYFKLIILKELDTYQLLSDESKKEIYLRNIISRLYYTAMHICIEKFNIDINPSEKTHPQVLNAITSRGLKQKLKSLKSLREKADYKIEPFNLPLTAQGRGGVVINSTEQIKDILEFFENL